MIRLAETVPVESGKIVGIINFRDRIILATEYHIYELNPEDGRIFRKLWFQEDEPEGKENDR